jgi:hypothetical protein
MHLARVSGLAAGLAAILVAVTGCGLFTPEDPPPPFGDDAARLPDLAVDPDSALVSMVQGLESKNIDLYIHGFADSQTTVDQAFHAFFDFQDLADYQVGTGAEPPADWLNQDERTFFPFFAGRRPVNYTVILFPDPERPDEFPDPAQDVIYFRKYRIWAVGDLVAHGVADFRIRRVGLNNEWRIVNWTDRRDTTATGVSTFGKWRLDSLSFR